MKTCANRNCLDEVKTGKKYCSVPCANREIQKQKEEKRLAVESQRVCSFDGCDGSLEGKDYRQKFCSHSCSAKFHNPESKRKHRGSDFCAAEDCNKPLKAYHRKFCSRLCSASHNAKSSRKASEEAWIKNEISINYSNGELPSWARKYLLKEANHLCTRCGWGEINPKVGKPILTIDHIDGDWKNNRRDNLVVLCYNCHTLTSTFGSLNAGRLDNWDRNVSGRTTKK